MIVSRFPFPLDKGDKLRAYYQLKELNKYYTITLVALSDRSVPKSDYDQVKKYCEILEICQLSHFSKIVHLLACLVNQKPFQTGYFYSWKAKRKVKGLISSQNFSHIYCQLIRTTEYVKDEHRIPKTLDYMDALSAGIRRRIDQQPFYKKWLFRSEARRLIKYEQHVFDYFENKIIISDQDKQLIHHPEKLKIHSIPNGIDASFFETLPIKKKYDFIFVGNMSYPPNVEAVHYIAREILPEFPESTFLISGSSPLSTVLALAERNSRITLTGWIEDIRESYAKGKIFLAPMMIGTGMQNKLLEAMAMKIPCVTTPLANNAIKATHGKEILVGKNKEEFIEAIRALQNDENYSRQLAHEGSEFVRKNYSWEKSVLALYNLIKKDK